MQLLKISKNAASYVYSYVVDKELTDNVVYEIVKNFKKAETEKEEIKGIAPLKSRRKKREPENSPIKALCYVNRDCFSIAIYPEQKLVEYSCRKKARSRFEEILMRMGHAIELS